MLCALQYMGTHSPCVTMQHEAGMLLCSSTPRSSIYRDEIGAVNSQKTQVSTAWQSFEAPDCPDIACSMAAALKPLQADVCMMPTQDEGPGRHG